MAGASAGLSMAGTSLLAVADNPAEAAAAVHDGAALVDFGTAGPAAIAEFRARHPGTLVCAACEQADVVRDPAMALRTGAILVCTDPAAAINAGLPAARLLVQVSPARLAAASAADVATLVDLADQRVYRGADLQDAGTLAIAAICAWLGATVIRTSHPGPMRRAVDMAESIRGVRPPARTVRGLG
jgi:dihydropteroate synthase